MLGIQYVRVAKMSMSKMLTRLTTDESVLKDKATAHQVVPPSAYKVDASAAIGTAGISQENANAGALTEAAGTRIGQKEKKKAKALGRPYITDDVRNLVANVSGIEAVEITPDAEMADFGIDSLMGMELAREVEIVFKCSLDQAELMEATSLHKLVVCISNALFGPDRGGTAAADEDDDDSSSDDAAAGAADTHPHRGATQDE